VEAEMYVILKGFPVEGHFQREMAAVPMKEP
jgi:hypothetical protein